MFFTKEEKSAIVHLAVAIQLADEDANKNETLLNSLVFAKLGIGSEDLNLARHMGLKEAINVVAKMTDSGKRFVSSFFGCNYIGRWRGKSCRGKTMAIYFDIL